MAAGEDWSRAEVRATVNDYMDMLAHELSGQAYNKAAHNRALATSLSGRSRQSVELKHQNISAVLNELGLFWIPGYKPRSNYHRLLADEIVAWLATHPEFNRLSLVAAEAPAVSPSHVDFSGFEVAKPELESREQMIAEPAGPYGRGNRIGIRRDYLARESRNLSLGAAGELLALRFEQERLSRAGFERLAGKVEHVSKTQGDGLGFDILSFEPSGMEQFIEVKTTAFAKETPFFASASEVGFARHNEAQYHLYRLFRFKSAPKCFILQGALEKHCMLDPDSFRCGFR